MEDENHAHIPANQQPSRKQPPQYPCQHCNKSFTTKQRLSVHLKWIHPKVNKTPHQCHVCRILLESPCKLERHLEHAHSEDRPHKCPKCELNCKLESNLKSHLKIHEENREKFKCSICGKEVLSISDLNRHSKEEYGSLNNERNTKGDNSQDNNEKDSVYTPSDQQHNQPLRYPCQHCDNSFWTQLGLRRHITCKHPEVNKKPYQCQVCQISFPTASKLTRHSGQAHNEDWPYNCSKCTFHCKTEWVLKSHFKIHDQNGGIFKCSICDKNYLSSDGLNYHLKTAHDSLSIKSKTESDNSQDSGDEQTSQGEASDLLAEAVQGSISRDQQRNQPLNYPCQRCDKSFTKQQGLSRHITCQHPEVNKKRHKCHVCQISFPTPSKLTRHSGQTHNQDWPYRCSKCTFHCKTESVLKSHLKIHYQNGGIFKCSICDKEYHSIDGLNYHLKTTHDSVSIKAKTESDNTQSNGDKKESQGEVSGVKVAAAPGNILLGESKSFENGIGTFDNPTTEPQLRSEAMVNAVPLKGCVGYSGSVYFSQEDQKKQRKENQKSDGAIEEADTATEKAPGETNQGVSFIFPSTHNEFFTSSNQTAGPSNAQCDASGGTKESSPKIFKLW